ncbi:MAG: polyprenyl synthetase family protein [Elusimicrobia bacterium]|nr:polyprenyl synthetase family protein [Elusimicrobiota bacterium]
MNNVQSPKSKVQSQEKKSSIPATPGHTDAAARRLEIYRLRLDRELKKIVGGKFAPGMLREAVSYALFPGGKRLRPILALIFGEGIEAPQNPLLAYACALEMIHNYTLIHDDLPAMDDDDWRRGRLSVHKKFGEAMGILAGDALLTQSFEVAAQSGSVEAVSFLARMSGAKGVIEGQTLDLGLDGNIRGDHDFLRLYELKTSRLFEAAIAGPALLLHRKLSVYDWRRLVSFGRLWGRCFQLADDLDDAGPMKNENNTVTLLHLWGEQRLREYLSWQIFLLKKSMMTLPLNNSSCERLGQVVRLLYSPYI